MIMTFVFPGLLSTILQLPPDATSTAVTAVTASPTLASVPTDTSTPTATTPTTTDSCTLISTVFPSTLPDVSASLPTGTRYYYQCGSSIVGVDLAVSGASTITYPAVNSTPLPAGYTQILASNGKAITTSTSTMLAVVTSGGKTATSSEASGLTLSISSSTVSAPSATMTNSGERKGNSLPQSFLGLAVAVGVVVLASL